MALDRKSNMSGIEMLEQMKRRAQEDGKKGKDNPAMTDNVPEEKDSVSAMTGKMPGRDTSGSVVTGKMPGRDTSASIVTGKMPGREKSAPAVTGKMPGKEKSDTSKSEKLLREGRDDIENVDADDVNLYKYNVNEGTQLKGESGEVYTLNAKFEKSAGTAEIWTVKGSSVIAKIYDVSHSGKNGNRHIAEFVQAFKDDPVDGLLQILDWGQIKSTKGHIRDFYILPFLSGTNLEEYLINHDMSENEVKDFVRKMNNVFHSLHKKGFYHRDIKPKNIMYDGNINHTCLIDYGSLTKGGSEYDFAMSITKKGDRTEGYTAPEIHSYNSASNLEEVLASEKTDYFSFGASIAEIYKTMQMREENNLFTDGEKSDTRLFSDDGRACTATMVNNVPYPPLLVEHPETFNLVQALLRYNPETRAGFEQVNEWLNGKMLYIDDSVHQERRTFKYNFDDDIYMSKKDLAKAMALDWEKSKKEVFQGLFQEKFKNAGMDLEGDISAIHYILSDYDEANVKDYEDAALLEILSRIGVDLPFMWKGTVYETSNGGADDYSVAEDLYNDAVLGGHEFDILVSTRALKELLYYQTRFLKDKDPEKKQAMKSVAQYNQIAEKSPDLAKLLAADQLLKRDDSYSFLVDKVSGGKFFTGTEYLKSIFTPDNFDAAMKEIYSGTSGKSNTLLNFLNGYKNEKVILAMLMSNYNVDAIPSITEENNRTIQLLQLISGILNITTFDEGYVYTLFDSKFFHTVTSFCIDVPESWSFITVGGGDVANDVKKLLDEHTSNMTNALKNMQSTSEVNKAFVRDVIPELIKMLNTIEKVKDLFVYDESLLKSGLVLVTKKDLYSAIVPENEESSLCLLNDKFLVPKIVAKKYYQPDGIKVSDPEPQSEIAKLSIEGCKSKVENFYSGFRKLAGEQSIEIANKKIINMIVCLLLTGIVVGIGLVLAILGFHFLSSSEFREEILNRNYCVFVISVDFVLGFLLLVGCFSDLKKAVFNIRLFYKNKAFLKHYRLIDKTCRELDGMQKSGKVRKLPSDEKDIVSWACERTGETKAYYDKYNLQTGNRWYQKIRPKSLVFVAIIGMLFLFFNALPVRNMTGALFSSNFEAAAAYGEKNSSIIAPVKFINEKMSYVSLAVLEKSSSSSLIKKYNTKEYKKSDFEKNRDTYMSLCENMGYELSDENRNNLEQIVSSKQSFVKGEKYQKKGKKKKAIVQFLNVLAVDSNYSSAQRYINEYLDTLYGKQQLYFEKGNEKGLKSLILQYKSLLSKNIGGEQLKNTYDTLVKYKKMNESAKHLVAYQMLGQKEKWIDDDVQTISCVRRKRGKYLIRIGKRNHGFESWINKYDYSLCEVTTYGVIYDVGEPDDVEFNMRSFDPDQGLNEYYKILY